MQDIVRLLEELGGRGSINEIRTLAKKKRLGMVCTDATMVRDTLIRLKSHDIVEGDVMSPTYRDDKWTLLKRPTEKE